MFELVPTLGEEMLEDPNSARKREWLEAGDWQATNDDQGQDEEDGSREPGSPRTRGII